MEGLGGMGSQDRRECRAQWRVRLRKGHRMCWVSPESPTQAQVLLVTACTIWGLAREDLEGLSGVHLSGEKVKVHWAHTPPRPLSKGGGGTRLRCEKGEGQGRAPTLPLQGLCPGCPWPSALFQRYTGIEPPAPEEGAAPLGPAGTWHCLGASGSARDS